MSEHARLIVNFVVLAHISCVGIIVFFALF